MKLRWKTINNFPDYSISHTGEVISTKNNLNKLLKKTVSSDGYYRVNLYKGGIASTKKVHLLVWDAFGNKPRNGRKLQVDHIDNNKLNNNIKNLQLLSNRENTRKYFIDIKNKPAEEIGIRWQKDRRKWMLSLVINGKQKTLGRFSTKEDAIKFKLEAGL